MYTAGALAVPWDHEACTSAVKGPAGPANKCCTGGASASSWSSSVASISAGAAPRPAPGCSACSAVGALGGSSGLLVACGCSTAGAEGAPAPSAGAGCLMSAAWVCSGAAAASLRMLDVTAPSELRFSSSQPCTMVSRLSSDPVLSLFACRLDPPGVQSAPNHIAARQG